MDVNDVFENILFAEEIVKQGAYKEGFKNGKRRLFEGFHLGYHRASLFAAHLGYYYGILLTYKKNPSERISKFAGVLLEEINKIIVNHTELDNLKEAFDGVKLKYNRFCTLAKINCSYPEANVLEF